LIIMENKLTDYTGKNTTSEQNDKQSSTVSVPLNGSVNHTCKPKGNYEKSLTKNEAILLLKSCNYFTSFTEISEYLEIIFGRWEEKPNHWRYIAQYYTPKSINSVLNQMTKMSQRGALPLNCAGAYFTKVLKRHKPRKMFRKEKGEEK